MAHLKLGKVRDAVALATETVKLMAAASAGDLGALPGHMGVTEVFLTLLESGEAAHERSARDACAGLRKYASIIALAQPQALLAQGRLEACLHRPDAANKCWLKAREVARASGHATRCLWPTDISEIEFRGGCGTDRG